MVVELSIVSALVPRELVDALASDPKLSKLENVIFKRGMGAPSVGVMNSCSDRITPEFAATA